MNDRMMKISFIALVWPHVEIGNFLGSKDLLRIKSLLKEYKKEPLNRYQNCGMYHMKKDWGRSSCLVCIVETVDIEVYEYTHGLYSANPYINKGSITMGYELKIFEKTLQDN